MPSIAATRSLRDPAAHDHPVADCVGSPVAKANVCETLVRSSENVTFARERLRPAIRLAFIVP